MIRLLPLFLLLSGCAGLRDALANVVGIAPAVGGDLATGTGEVVASGGVSIPGWLKIVGAVATLVAAGIGGPKAITKVKGIFGR